MYFTYIKKIVGLAILCAVASKAMSQQAQFCAATTGYVKHFYGECLRFDNSCSQQKFKNFGFDVLVNNNSNQRSCSESVRITSLNTNDKTAILQHPWFQNILPPGHTFDIAKAEGESLTTFSEFEYIWIEFNSHDSIGVPCFYRAKIVVLPENSLASFIPELDVQVCAQP